MSAVIPLAPAKPDWNSVSVPGVNVLLEGPTGTGKTYALGPLVDWCEREGIEVFVLFTEYGVETLLGYWTDKKQAIPANLHWHMQNTKPLPLLTQMEGAKKVGQLNYESLTKLVDPNRHANNAYLAILESLNKPVCDRCKKEFPSAAEWKPGMVLVIDSLTELANACMKMQIGNKPTASQPDYGVAQNMLMNFLRLATQGISCHFVLTAHIARVRDEITGGTKIMTSSIGQAIAGDIPVLFSETILTVREGSDFFWDTASMMADLKTRYLPINSRNKPDFGVILNKWKERALAK